jgi:hypothetical protein
MRYTLMPYQYHFTNTNFTEASYENTVFEVFRETLDHGNAYGPDVERDYAWPLCMDELLPRLMSGELFVGDANGTLWTASPTRGMQGEFGLM